ncbi:uncharacterized protein [Primulina eburnea]|uniref:uncharacterized protein n=1 Tax=Primulina eburnea TaxID=1245227 RepID=UPI003C6C7356
MNRNISSSITCFPYPVSVRFDPVLEFPTTFLVSHPSRDHRCAFEPRFLRWNADDKLGMSDLATRILDNTCMDERRFDAAFLAQMATFTVDAILWTPFDIRYSIVTIQVSYIIAFPRSFQGI